MTIKIAINGFGRIGRLVFRLLSEHSGMHVVAINDVVPPENLSYLLKYDTVHGRFDAEIALEKENLIVNGRKTRIVCERDPKNLPWRELEVDYVLESTGLFTSIEGAKKHLEAGAKRVLISAPAKGEGIPTFVIGVNQEKYRPESDYIISNASCTTNCLAPLTKVLLDNYGIEEGLMTTVHAMTATQPTVDGPSHKDLRGGRAASQNIIPSSTGAANAVALCLPQIKGKLTGMALRVPVADVSIVDLTVKLSRPTSYDAICLAMRQASEGAMKGILGYCNEPVVSSDFIGSKYSSIFDELAGIGLNDTFYKIVGWYDNEMGYACRCVDLLALMASKE